MNRVKRFAVGFFILLIAAGIGVGIYFLYLHFSSQSASIAITPAVSPSPPAAISIPPGLKADIDMSNTLPNYVKFSNVDIYGNDDSCSSGGQSVNSLATTCNANPNCVGFNFPMQCLKKAIPSFDRVAQSAGGTFIPSSSDTGYWKGFDSSNDTYFDNWATSHNAVSYSPGSGSSLYLKSNLVTV